MSKFLETTRSQIVFITVMIVVTFIMLFFVMKAN